MLSMSREDFESSSATSKGKTKAEANSRESEKRARSEKRAEIIEQYSDEISKYFFIKHGEGMNTKGLNGGFELIRRFNCEANQNLGAVVELKTQIQKLIDGPLSQDKSVDFQAVEGEMSRVFKSAFRDYSDNKEIDLGAALRAVTHWGGQETVNKIQNSHSKDQKDYSLLAIAGIFIATELSEKLFEARSIVEKASNSMGENFDAYVADYFDINKPSPANNPVLTFSSVGFVTAAEKVDGRG
jgi:hypothetical protein